VTANNPIADLLGVPLGPGWTVEDLAEQVLGAIAGQRSEETPEFVLDTGAVADRQSRRLLRPLLACLATKSAAEAGTPVNLYGGCFSFKRPGPQGPVWILGQFENRPGSVRVALRRSCTPPEASEGKPGPSAALTDALSHLMRALEGLEQVGTGEAREVLETLAKGAPGALATREAQAALDRLARRASAKP
jgi:hypothetical protein